MQIHIIATGKIKEKYLLQGINDYLTRLKPYARVNICEVKDEKLPDKASPADEAALLEREAQRFAAKIKPGTYLIALAIKGKRLTSPAFARHIQKLALRGDSHVTFIIGSSLGLSPKLLDHADLVLSFSDLTFPHRLFRLLLLEQLYRSFKIMRNEPYHK